MIELHENECAQWKTVLEEQVRSSKKGAFREIKRAAKKFSYWTHFQKFNLIG